MRRERRGPDREARLAGAEHGRARPDSDELDEATGPPALAETGLRWQDDPEHAQAVADVVARAHSNIDKFGLEAGRTARLKQQAADIVNGLKEAFRMKFYAEDKPAKVEPWLEPLVDGAAATTFTAHPRRYTMSQLTAEMEVELENAASSSRRQHQRALHRVRTSAGGGWRPRSTSKAAVRKLAVAPR